MKNVKTVLNEVLKEIEPDEKYQKEMFKRINEIIIKINRGLKDANAVLGGSGAKGTWLKTFDADIFVLFDYRKYNSRSQELSDILEIILKKNFNGLRKLHGSRDYFQLKHGNFTFEIVPILKITKAEQAKNITDVSPLHSRWVLRHKKLASEMKLAKQFCKANNLYGAESHLRGFSGYVCEILSVHYGSFINILKNAAKWQEKTLIDVEKYYRRQDVFKIINTSKLASPLIVIDPVQKDRNAAAALSLEKFSDFKVAAAKFLRKPSKDFFRPKRLMDKFLKGKIGNRNLIMVKLSALDGKSDIAGSKIVKAYEFFIRELEKNEFKIIKKGLEFQDSAATACFLFGKKGLEKTRLVEGPPLKLSQHVLNFKKLHKKTFKKNGKIVALEKRKFTKAEELLKKISKENYVKERCKSVKIKAI